MMRRGAALLLALLAGSCGRGEERSQIYLQRFFGECHLPQGEEADIAKAEGECGIITTMINAYNEQNPDARVSSNVVAWPGYPQLTAQIAAGDPPDLVTMHEGVITDYANRGLLEPVEPYLREAGIDPASFTDASRLGVTVNDHLYGLPWDTHGGLFHVNPALFAEAGLMRDGRPILPTSAEEFLAQARQFKARTGKPYLIQSLVGDPAYAARNLYTYLMAQDVAIFPDAKHIRLNTPQAHAILAFFKQITDEGLATRNMDTPAAIAAFRTGQGGIYPTGTWMIGEFEQRAATPGEPLFHNYAVYPYPRLWGHDAVYVSGHAWVVPRRERTPAQRSAIARFFRFMAAHNFDWARTGHLPAFRAIIDSPQFAALPHRADIAPMATTGHPLPSYVLRQNAIEGIVGEEAAAAVNGQKGIDQALADAERRVNELLAQMP
jgi:multiple sugar transport system substrate-binding protein